MDRLKNSNRSSFLQGEGHRFFANAHGNGNENISIELEPLNSPPDFNDKDFGNLIDLLCGKGLRVWNNFGGNKSDVEDFKKKNLKGNIFLKIAMSKILFEMGSERRIGNGLKGMSKTLLEQIQLKLWDLVHTELKINKKDIEIKDSSILFTKQIQRCLKQSNKN